MRFRWLSTDTSPVKAPLSSKWQFSAAMIKFFAAATAVDNAVNGAPIPNVALSLAAAGSTASMNSLVSFIVLFIFQFPTIIGFLM